MRRLNSIRCLALALGLAGGGCSLVLDTSELDLGPTGVQSPVLYEGLGAGIESRAVPVAVRGLELDDGDTLEVQLADDPAVACTSSCIEVEPSEAGNLCCQSPTAGRSDGAYFATALRLPVIEGADLGTDALVLRVLRGDEERAELELELEYLPENGQDDLTITTVEPLRLSRLAPGQSTLLVQGPGPVRIRVTGDVIMLRSDAAGPGSLESIISFESGSCPSPECAPGAGGSTLPLRGGGPEGTDNLTPGGGAGALQIDGSLRVNGSGGRTAIINAKSTEDGGGGGGAVVVTVGGLFVGSPPRLDVDDNGESRAIGRNSENVDGAGTALRGPRLEIGAGGGPDTLLPTIGREPLVELIVSGDDQDRASLVVESIAGQSLFEINDSRVDLALDPGLNRVCIVLGDDIPAPLPDDIMELGQCFYTVYLP
ncbi:MAG: hypothetical protein KJO07_19115 [Deltaproteobacteria bacterium]|nr:hypothetical protein [Deltaproteobacteria bacterium]